MIQKIKVIDTFGFFFRSYFALPPLSSKDGFPTGLLTGFLRFVTGLIKEQDDHTLILFALDAPGKSFRSAIDAEYKAHRPPAPDDLKAQLPVATQWLEKMGFSTLSEEGFEADDIIATVAHLGAKAGFEVEILSHDKDLIQLIGPNITLIDPIKKKRMDQEACVEKYGVEPQDFIYYQALIGDSADNIPGVKGIGPKTAQALISEYNTLDNLYQNLDAITKKRTFTLLDSGKENAYRSLELVTLRQDVYSHLPFERYHQTIIDPIEKIADELISLNMDSFLKNTPKPAPKPGSTFKATTLDTKEKLFNVLNNITPETIIAFDTETTGLDDKTDTLVGFSFCFNDTEAFYVPMAHQYLGVSDQLLDKEAKEALIELFKYPIVGHNLKFDLKFVEKYLDTSLSFKHDTMIMAWLLEPSMPVGLDKLADRFFNHTMIAYKTTVKKGETFANVFIEEATKYAAEDAFITYKLYGFLKEHLEEEALKTLDSIETPLIPVLQKMETEGILLDTDFMQTYKLKIEEELRTLTQHIYELAGGEFNINSTKQLGVILFETLQLPVIKKTKTGYSTDEKVLNKLLDEHPIIAKLLEYRELFKLYSTYIQPLLELAHKDIHHRIYTSFIQTGTATGRLSSKNPNLQNIPTKSAYGKQIRQAFVAPEGKTFISIDYSQIELRLLAHFSQDPTLVTSFNNNKDIHLATATKLFNEEAQAKRHIAKTVNFGLLYGMGSKKLSETLSISTKDAKTIIENYFQAFPTIQTYMQSIEDYAQEHGYVQTLMKRKRYFDFEKANGMQLAAYKREAVNTVFQGSAADLIKMAMIKIDRYIKEHQLKAKLLLQIHDELIFEVDQLEATSYANDFENIMRTIYPLHIPLECSVSIAPRWGELK
jgi:DNA polymerase-1